MKYIKIKNWDDFQAFKDGRKIKWIKLLIDIIDEFDHKGFPKKFYKMPDSAKLTFLALICLKPRYSEQIPYPSDKWLKEQLGIRTLNLQPIISNGFIEICTESVQSRTEPYESVPEKEIEKEIEKEKETGRFTPPPLSDVKKYIAENNYKVDAIRWHDFYTAKNWMIGKNKMKDWKAAVRTWTRGESVADNKACIVDKKPGVKRQVNSKGDNIWLCTECFAAFRKIRPHGSWTELKPEQITTIVLKGKSQRA